MGEKRRKNGSLISKGGLISAFSIGVALLLLIRQIPVTNLIGDEGMGYFAGTYELYMVFVLLTAFSIPTAMGKMIALRVNRGQYRNANQVFKTGFFFCLILGIVLGVVLLLFSGSLTEGLLKLPYGKLAFCCFIPTLLVVLVSSAFLGFFQGMGSMMPTSVSKLISAVIQFVMCLVIGYMVYSYGKKASVVLNEPSYASAFGATGISLGILTGEIFALLFLVLLYFAYNKTFHKQVLNDTTKTTETTAEIISMLLAALAPFMVGSLLLHSNVIVNQIIYNQSMVTADQLTLATNYGIYYGKYYVLTGIPIAILSVMAGNFSNIYGKMIARENYYHAKRFFTDSLKEILIVSGVSALILIVLAGPLIEILYKGDSVTAIKMMRIGSVAVVFYGVAFLTQAALCGHGKIWLSNSTIIASIVIQALLLKILLITTELGILAVVIANIVFPLIISIGNMLILKKCQE